MTLTIPHYIPEKFRTRPSTKRAYVVAVLGRERYAVADAIMAGCASYFARHSKDPINLVFFNGKDDEKTMFGHALTIVENYRTLYDATIVIGAGAALMMAHASKLTASPIPIIFSNVHRPEQLGILYPGRRHRTNISGIAVPGHDHAGQIETLSLIQENVRTVLLPFSAEYSTLDEYVHDLIILGAEKNISIIPYAINKKIPLAEQLKNNLADVDMIMTVRESFFSARINELTAFCDQYKLPSYTSDLELVARGAAFGYSPELSSTIEDLARHVLLLFEEHADAYELPVKLASFDYYLGINKETVAKNNIPLDQRSIEHLTNTIIFGGKES